MGFDFLAKYDGGQYSFIAIDLPFHGRTEWKEGLNFTAEDLRQILKEIPEVKNQKLTFLGFSLHDELVLLDVGRRAEAQQQLAAEDRAADLDPFALPEALHHRSRVVGRGRAILG